MTTAHTFLPNAIPMDVETPCLYAPAYGVLENYSVIVPNVSKTNASRTFIRDVFDFFDFGEVTSVQYVETNDIHEIRIHFKPYDSINMHNLMERHSGNMFYSLRLFDFNDSHDLWQIFSLPLDSISPPQAPERKTKEVIMLENKMTELKEAVEMIPELVSTLESLNARIKYLEDPEWLDDICQPLTMEDLSTSTADRMAVEKEIIPARCEPISEDDLSDVDEMDTDSDSLAEIWPMPFNPS